VVRLDRAKEAPSPKFLPTKEDEVVKASHIPHAKQRAANTARTTFLNMASSFPNKGSVATVKKFGCDYYCESRRVRSGWEKASSCS